MAPLLAPMQNNEALLATGLITHINFSNRPTLEWARQRTWSAIKVLENAEIYKRNLVLAKTRRIKRQEKIERAQVRLIRRPG